MRGWRRRWRKRTAQLTAAKERLENQSERLKRANAFKSEVLGTVAHDLKNPLGVILGRTEMLNEMLLMSPLPEESARAQLEHIRQTARRLTDMVEELIADARADAVDISVRAYEPDFGLLVEEVAENNRKLASAKDQEIVVEVAAGPPGQGRHGAAARGGRQSGKQRREIQSARRPYRCFGAARGR